MRMHPELVDQTQEIAEEVLLGLGVPKRQEEDLRKTEEDRKSLVEISICSLPLEQEPSFASASWKQYAKLSLRIPQQSIAQSEESLVRAICSLLPSKRIVSFF